MEFLGKGWSFPPTFNKSRGGVRISEGVEDIKESLQILLSTRVGERVMLPSFGCNMDDLVFENVDISLKTYLADLVETAIIEYEPRIELDAVVINTADQYEGVVLIEVQFTVRATNSRFNFVYPFYQKEGADQ
ncbi:GPW/gp25 family protein [Flavilitoribacter nigricans]|uniref:IraD/Gp25-like domain-containing protein n=1 Tax=Flavilitoribacter nigricans (strain ATCC 23147 / DSM 23189 / NBRC 102662 / NCIMB 1420 / SS-2) TaxID=1122177 RepID=A0A2D0NCY2_FLAN2|nr:GPW/gp25 family protein [Flavilitoribacter nigricans]PHN06362.1 hypothetical protein CRP01_12390 [Flavilitoribacter nigricans DSM 23189 = NBRC 102662]